MKARTLATLATLTLFVSSPGNALAAARLESLGASYVLPDPGDSSQAIAECHITYFHDTNPEPIEPFVPEPRQNTPYTDEVHARLIMDEGGVGYTAYMFRCTDSRVDSLWGFMAMARDGYGHGDDLTIEDREDCHSGYPGLAFEHIHRDTAALYLAWIDARDGNTEIYYRKLWFDPWYHELHFLGPALPISSLDGYESGRWVDPKGEPDSLDDPRGPMGTALYPEHPDIAVGPDHTVHIVWSDHRDGYWQVYYQKQTNDANPTVQIDDKRISNWADPRELPRQRQPVPPGMRRASLDLTPKEYLRSDSFYPAVAVDAQGNVHIAWQKDLGGHYEIFTEKLDSQGNTLIDDELLSSRADAHNSAAPDLAVDDSGNVRLVWMDDATGQWEIWAATLCPVDHSSIGEFPATPKGQENGDWATKRISDFAADTTNYLYGTYTGQPYGDGPSMYPQIATNGTEARVVYQDARSGDWQVYFSEFDEANVPSANEDIYGSLLAPDKYPTLGTNSRYDDYCTAITYQENTGTEWEMVSHRRGGGVFDPYVVLAVADQFGDTTYLSAFRQYPYGGNALEGIEYIRPFRASPGRYWVWFQGRNDYGEDFICDPEEIDILDW